MPAFKALGGAALLGSKLVRLVYVDEAGTGNAEHEPFMVFAGVIVDVDRKLQSLEQELDRLVEKHIPAQHQSGFVFHAKELFHGHKAGSGDVFDRDLMPLEARLRIADDLAEVPGKISLPFVVGYLDKRQEDDGQPDDATAAETQAVAYMRCALSVDLWMRANAGDEYCLLVVEDNEAARSAIRSFHNHYTNRRAFDGAEEEFLPLRKIKQAPLFEPKATGSALQLADFCAYVSKRVLMDPSDERYLRYWRKMASLCSTGPLDPRGLVAAA